MRERRLIKEGSPCTVDYTDKTIQSVSDALKKGRALCANIEQCQKRSSAEDIQCALTMANVMTGCIIDDKNEISQVIENEKNDFLKSCPQNKFWVRRDGKWFVVNGKENVINDIVAFALIIIDLKPGERRPFTKDGTRIPELGLGDAMHNALLDLDDMYAEVGQKNPRR